MKLISYYIVYPLSQLIGLLPIKVQFWLSDAIRWVLYKVIRYRLNVVRENLKKSFLEMSDQQRLDIEKKFYKHLADVFIETMSLSSMRINRLKERMVFLNADQIEDATKGKNWVSAMAHYSNWEFTIGYAMCTSHDGVLGVYRPLRNKGFDKVFHKIRCRFGVAPTPMGDIGKQVITSVREGKCYAIALISDQNAPRFKNAKWCDFLGQKTLFFTGMEKFALKFKMPVAFLHVDKFERGFYTGWFELIYDGVEEVAPGEVTKRYVSRLEEMIRKKPELWMWSHRRWKHKYDGDINDVNN